MAENSNKDTFGPGENKPAAGKPGESANINKPNTGSSMNPGTANRGGAAPRPDSDMPSTSGKSMSDQGTPGTTLHGMPSQGTKGSEQTHTTAADQNVVNQQWGQTHKTSDTFTDQMTSHSDKPMEQVREKAAPMVEDAKEQAQQVMDKAQQRAFSMLDEQKTRAADTLGSVAGALRTTGEQLNQKDQGNFGQYAEKAANAVEHFADSLQNKNLNELFDEAQGFARREPQIFLGGAVIAGILLARFLKSSKPEPDFNADFTPSYGPDYGRNYGRSYQPGTYRQGYRVEDRRSADPLKKDYDESWTGEDFYPPRSTGPIR